LIGVDGFGSGNLAAVPCCSKGIDDQFWAMFDGKMMMDAFR
jgi:hypothetical protein